LGSIAENEESKMDEGLAGHNIAGAVVRVEVRLFNSLRRFSADGEWRQLTLPAGSCIGDALARLAIPPPEVCLAWINGRDVTASLHTDVNVDRALADGDVLALSGPVPYSWGYGAPVL
jgi:hypothetical protein